ncbi:uncharacterized protein LOC128884219 isoform X2 [Hylaeus volcanicus]|uniref:uncharacterized protein LOC128884219 isoform X2 n=1 Tax=Hylaeus volcanicus TaxID=313075 RepID=UPI0023B8508B|nr:uncharacterized protein LOC128884219 isoform X2 [Hylaeus volcanicus]
MNGFLENVFLIIINATFQFFKCEISCQTPAYIHMKTFDFLCAFHASEAKHTKKINEERFSSTEVDKILKRYNGEKKSEKCSIEKFQFTSKDLWPVTKRKSCKECIHALTNDKSVSESYHVKDRKQHCSSESGACSSDDSAYSFNKRRIYHKTINQASNICFNENKGFGKNSNNFDDREISTHSALLPSGSLPRNISRHNHPSTFCSHLPCSKCIDSSTLSCCDMNLSISNDVSLCQKKIPATMNKSSCFKSNNKSMEWTEKKTIENNPFSQKFEHSQISAPDSPSDHNEQVYFGCKKNPFDIDQCRLPASACFNSTTAMQVPCMKYYHNSTAFGRKQKNICETNFINTSHKIQRNALRPHLTTTNVKVKEWWEV